MQASDDPAITIHKAQAFDKETDRYRVDTARRLHRAPQPGTMRFPVGAYRAHNDFLDLSPEDSQKYGCLRLKPEGLPGTDRLVGITPPATHSIKRSMRAKAWAANAHLHVLCILLNFGIRKGC